MKENRVLILPISIHALRGEGDQKDQELAE